jgi:hypothetical protein
VARDKTENAVTKLLKLLMQMSGADLEAVGFKFNGGCARTSLCDEILLE